MQCTVQCPPDAHYGAMVLPHTHLPFLRPVAALELPQATLAAVERQDRKRCGRTTVAPAAAVHARTVAAAVVPAKPRVGRVAYAAQPESLLARSAGFGLGVGQHARTDGDEQH